MNNLKNRIIELNDNLIHGLLETPLRDQDIRNIISELTEIEYAVYSSDYDFVKSFFVKGKSKKNELSGKSLMMSLIKKDIKMIEILLENGVDINQKYNLLLENNKIITRTPLIFTLSLVNFKSLFSSERSLLSHNKIKINEYLEIVRLLIKKNADLNAEIKSGITALKYCLAMSDNEGMMDFIKYLLKSKADPRAGDTNNFSALHIICERSNPRTKLECLDLILEAKVDINTKNKNGKTPLHVACQYSKQKKGVSTVEYLLEKKANVNSVFGSKKRTPFFFVLKYYKSETNVPAEHKKTADPCVLPLLIENGADLFIVSDDNGKSDLERLVDYVFENFEDPVTKRILGNLENLSVKPKTISDDVVKRKND